MFSVTNYIIATMLVMAVFEAFESCTTTSWVKRLRNIQVVAMCAVIATLVVRNEKLQQEIVKPAVAKPADR